jgi:hypothetical protein
MDRDEEGAPAAFRRPERGGLRDARSSVMPGRARAPFTSREVLSPGPRARNALARDFLLPRPEAGSPTGQAARRSRLTC